MNLWGDVPFLIRIKDHENWKLLKELNSIESFSKFCNEDLEFRLIDRTDKETQWEDESPSLRISPNEFNNWLRGASNHDLLRSILPENFSLYAAYLYVHETFKECPSLLNLIDWTPVGLANRGPEHTTFWLGSSGAYTPGHFDTYGCNVVAQLVGSKRWVLFPPEQTSFLYPTRQPYEESSVFSRCCQLEKYKNYQQLEKSTPFVVDLKPGDILFVPPRWWHFVKCLETSLTINTWIDIPHLDNFGRVEEALVRWILASQVSSEQPVRVNYTEKEPLDASECEMLLGAALKIARQKCDKVNPWPSKLLEAATRNNWEVFNIENIKFKDFTSKYIDSAEEVDDDDDEDDDDEPERTDRDKILDALLAPDVIQLVAKKLTLDD